MVWIAPEKRPKIDAMSAEDVIAELVEDAAILEPTPMHRFILGIEWIAHKRRTTAEAAYLMVLDAVEKRTGTRRMPMQPRTPGFLTSNGN